MSGALLQWQQQCYKFLDGFKHKRHVTRVGLTQRGTCNVDIRSPEFHRYVEQHGCETQSAYSIEYIPEERKVWGEFLIGHCPTRKRFQSFLFTPPIDLSKYCIVEQVHIHAGQGCPTTHIHFRCEVPIGEPINPLLHNITWMTRKLDNYQKATCN